MKIDDLIRKSTVFVGVERQGIFTPLGTGVLTALQSEGLIFAFLVTANHVVDSVAGDEIFVRVNRQSGGCETVRIPKRFRLQHSDAGNDIAVLTIKLDHTVHDFLLVPLDRKQILESRKNYWDPGLGDEVVVIGLYTSHYGLTKNIPVVRVGHLAAMPDEPVRTEFGYVVSYLIETKSIAGLSGSPVYLSIPPVRIENGDLQISKERTHPIIGILVGYHVVESKEDQISVPQFQKVEGAKSASADRGIDERNTGFAVVIPIERVLDILEAPGMETAIKIVAQQHFQNSGYRPSVIGSERSDEEK